VEYREKLAAAKLSRNEVVESDNRRFNPQFQPHYGKGRDRLKKKARRKSNKMKGSSKTIVDQPAFTDKNVPSGDDRSINSRVPTFAGTCK